MMGPNGTHSMDMGAMHSMRSMDMGAMHSMRSMDMGASNMSTHGMNKASSL
jgi:hypothetical protein